MALLPKWLDHLLRDKGEDEEEPDYEQLDFLSAIQVHLLWKRRLEAYVYGFSDERLDPLTVGRDDLCVLGKWIHGPGGERYSHNPLFCKMKKTHALFHECAGEIVHVTDKGDQRGALEMLDKGPYVKHSYQVRAELARLAREIGD